MTSWLMPNSAAQLNVDVQITRLMTLGPLLAANAPKTALSDNARLLHSQQSEMARQSEMLSQVVQATGDIVNLEQGLNDNLRALSGAKNFEDTVMSLAAAIHLLNTRLGEPSRGAGPVDLDTSDSQGRAA